MKQRYIGFLLGGFLCLSFYASAYSENLSSEIEACALVLKPNNLDTQGFSATFNTEIVKFHTILIDSQKKRSMSSFRILKTKKSTFATTIATNTVNNTDNTSITEQNTIINNRNTLEKQTVHKTPNAQITKVITDKNNAIHDLDKGSMIQKLMRTKTAAIFINDSTLKKVINTTYHQPHLKVYMQVILTDTIFIN